MRHRWIYGAILASTFVGGLTTSLAQEAQAPQQNQTAVHEHGIDGLFSDFPDTAVTSRHLFSLGACN